jgi:trehalose 6-phosphate synthase
MASDPTPLVLVSNRGPLSFSHDADGGLVARRGAGGLVSGIGPLVAGTDTTWLAAAISEGDRAAAAQGTVAAEGFQVRLLTLDPEAYGLAYDVVSNGALWFAHHGLWDLVHEPAFDRRWPEAWEAYRHVNESFAAEVAEVAPEGAVVLVQDYHLALVGRALAGSRPDLTAVHFTHTPFAPPVWLAALPEAHARELLDGMAAHRACGFHTGPGSTTTPPATPRWAPGRRRRRSRRRSPRTPPTSPAPPRRRPVTSPSAGSTPSSRTGR